MAELHVAWLVWACCAFIGIAAAAYCMFQYIKEQRRAKKRRAELDIMWERFFNHVEVLEGPVEVLPYKIRRELIG